VRVRFGTNDPTPWPPELPAGENPPPGGIIDYYLTAGASGPVRLEILDAAGKVVRAYSSEDSAITPDPALDPAAYDKVCQADPRAPHCALPFYWPAPQMKLSTRSGMHRFSWDLHFDPIGERAPQPGGATGAVPRRTYPAVNAPWAPPGAYTVRLTVNGKRFTQPLTLRLDPRVRTRALGLQRLAALSREMYDGARAAHDAYAQARALAARLDSAGGPDAAAFKAQVESLAPAPRPAPRGFAGFGRGPAGPPTLESLSGRLLSAAMAMQSADVTPTASQVAACDSARASSRDLMGRWTALKTIGLAALNARRKGASLPEVTLP
jgi:hypothetical protein